MNERDPTNTDEIDEAEERKARAFLVAQKAEGDDTKWLMSNKRGRRIVWGMLRSAGVFKLTFNTNAMTMSFNEGRRSEGLVLLAQIMDACPDLYFEMTRENSK